MKKVFIIQSVPGVTDLIREKINKTFHDMDNVFYESNFEKALVMIPEKGEIVVIASDMYHDDQHILFASEEKDGSKLAEEIKKINPLAKVYIYSTYQPRGGYVDGFFPKGLNIGYEIVEIFFNLGIN